MRRGFAKDLSLELESELKSNYSLEVKLQSNRNVYRKQTLKKVNFFPNYKMYLCDE